MLRGNTGGSQDALDDAAGAPKGERAYRALAGPCADKLDEGRGRVRPVDDLGEQGRIDRATSSGPVVQNGHVVDFEQLALGC